MIGQDATIDYTQSGMNNKLQADDSLSNKNNQYLDAYTIDALNDGNSVINRQVKSVSASKIRTGMIAAETLITIGLGGTAGQVIIDGSQKTIVVNDGVNDRILIGYQANGF